MKALQLIGLCYLMIGSSVFAANTCGTYSVPGSAVDLAPPIGYVESCSKDAVLCRKLTTGYPQSTKTLAYFVPEREWKEHREGNRQGFSRYLIAQAALATPPSEFEELKTYIRSRQGDIPDHTELPYVLKSEGRTNLGVLEDSPDAIVVGILSKLRVPPPQNQEIVLASSNIALLSRKQLFSLYVFVDITKEGDPAPMRELTKKWLGCLRNANKP